MKKRNPPRDVRVTLDEDLAARLEAERVRLSLLTTAATARHLIARGLEAAKPPKVNKPVGWR